MTARLLPIPLADDRLAAASTTRHGGVSEHPFASLNCGYSSGDDPARVWENRRRACGDLRVDPEALVVGGQVHETHVAVVTEAERGRGARGPDSVLSRTDGLLTDVPGLPLTVSSADCVPVFLHAPAARVVGILHAGWRGALQGILDVALARLHDTWRVQPADLHVAFGPAIGPCCFEIGADVATQAAALPDADAHLRPTGPEKWHFDLRGYLTARATDAGVPAGQVASVGPCTKCATDRFFSYRAEGPRSGRAMSVIALRAGDV